MKYPYFPYTILIFIIVFWFYANFKISSIELTKICCMTLCFRIRESPMSFNFRQCNFIEFYTPYAPFFCHIFAACFYPVGIGFSEYCL